MPATVPTTEGKMLWTAPNAGIPCHETWYRVYGDLKSGVCPLVVLHGGPGVTSDYVANLSLVTVQHSIPVIIYDQLGNGRSTHLPEKKGDATFWTEQLFLDELKRLLEHLGVYSDYNLLGHSWGGMLGARHAVRQPGGLKHLIISSSPASIHLWVEAQSVHRVRLPQDVQDTLDRYEKEGKTESREYQDAVGVYYSRHLCRISPIPEPLQETFGWLQKDSTVNMTMYGPSVFQASGSMKDWSILDEARKIAVPTLLTNGWNDQAADSCVYPFFKLIPRVRWVQFAESGHMAHWEETEKFMDIVAKFLTEE